MTATPLTDQQLDEIEALRQAATPGPWATYDDGTGLIDIAADLDDTGHGYRCRRYIGQLEAGQIDNDPQHRDWTEEQDRAQMVADAAYIAAMSPETARALVAEVRRLRADAAADLLPTWEAMYEPGNVSDYLIGYANSEAGAKGAAEAWMRSEAEVAGRLEWVPQNPLDGYDQEFELVERHDDGVDTGPGIAVRHRRPAVVPPAVETGGA